MMSQPYESFLLGMGRARFHLENDALYVMLVAGYLPDPTAHTMRADVIANEVSGTGYKPGGKRLTECRFMRDTVLKRPVFMAANLIWPKSTITATGAVIYKFHDDAANAELVAYHDFGGSVISENGDFRLLWNPSGIIRI